MQKKLFKVLGIIIMLIISFSFGINSCYTAKNSSTAAIPVVDDFDLDRYLGTWYEIARLPNSFEKNLERVTATYSRRDDGRIDVLNRGFDTTKNSWKQARGKAWVPEPQEPARLKVSFFWIFASDYKVIALDHENYSYAMVTSSSKKYLWILSRTPQMAETLYARLVQQAKEFGFNVDLLQKVSQIV